MEKGREQDSWEAVHLRGSANRIRLTAIPSERVGSCCQLEGQKKRTLS